MKKLLKALCIICTLVSLTGCSSMSTITEIDPVTGKVTKIIETSKPIMEQLMESTKNKTIYIWSKGWATKISVSTATLENPTPTFRIYAGNVDHGILSLHKDQKNLPDVVNIIKACNSSALNISTSGVTSGSDK